MNNIYNLISKIESALGDNYGKYIQLLIACLKLIKTSIPTVGIEAFELAKKYWIDKTLSDEELEAARIKCWEYIDAQGSSTDLDDKKIYALRSVICVLYSEQPSEDNGELLEFFFGTFEKVNGETNQLNSLVEGFLSKVK